MAVGLKKMLYLTFVLSSIVINTIGGSLILLGELREMVFVLYSTLNNAKASTPGV